MVEQKLSQLQSMVEQYSSLVERGVENDNDKQCIIDFRESLQSLESGIEELQQNC